MGVIPAAMLVACAGQWNAYVVGGATLLQRYGELPVGLADGSSLLAYDTELTPLLQIGLSEPRTEVRVSYQPRFLLRVSFLEQGPELLETEDLPFLLLHDATAEFEHRIAPRWTWSGAAQGQSGQMDFVLFAGGGAPGEPGTPGGPTTTPVAPVIQVESLSVETSLVGPLIGHDDFRITASLRLLYPGDLGEGVAPAPDNGDQGTLCFGGGDAAVGADPGGLFANTCTFGLNFATISALSEVTTLEIRGGYELNDFQPGPMLHGARADVRLVTRTTASSSLNILAGGILLADASPEEGAESLRVLPRLLFGAEAMLLQLRALQLRGDTLIGLDALADPLSRQLLTRAEGSIGVTALFERDVTATLRAGVFALSPESSCPPRTPLVGVPRGGCPEDFDDPALAESARGAELPDLSGVFAELGSAWLVDRSVSLLAGARFALRGPHVSRFGDEDAATAQRELSAQVGIRVLLDSRGGDGPVTAMARR